MGPRSPVGSGGIFISYRREDSAYPAGWLYDRLASRFGEGQIFKDIDSIAPGDDFVDRITTAVESCEVLLALIGDEWLTVSDAGGRRRLDDPNDFVRLEVEAALSRNVRVIPVLVEGARMPHVEELPPTLAPLVRRQALELNPSRFAADLGRLLTVLESTPRESSDEAVTDVRPGQPPLAAGEGRERWPRPLVTAAKVVGAVVGLLALVLVAGESGAEGFDLLFLLGLTAFAIWEGVRPGATSPAEKAKRWGIALMALGVIWTVAARWTFVPQLTGLAGIWLFVHSRTLRRPHSP